MLGREKILTAEVVLAVLKEAARSSGRDRTLMMALANTGLRCSEVLHIRVRDLDPDSSTITVTRRKRKKMAPEPHSVGSGLIKELLTYAQVAGKAEGDWLFEGRAGPCSLHGVRRCSGGHLTTRRVRAIWDRLIKKVGAKMRGRGVHTLRHYDLTRFYASTKDLRATQERAGHSSPVTTTVYAHVVDMREKVEKMGIVSDEA